MKIHSYLVFSFFVLVHFSEKVPTIHGITLPLQQFPNSTAKPTFSATSQSLSPSLDTSSSKPSSYFPTFVGNLSLYSTGTYRHSASKPGTSSKIASKTSSSASSTITPPPSCSEGNNSDLNNDPSSWCYCGVLGPFSTIEGRTTEYCVFSTLPTQTITLKPHSTSTTKTTSLKSHSSSINTACVITSITNTLAPSPTLATYCLCGHDIVGIETVTNSGGTKFMECVAHTTFSTILPPPTSTKAAPTSSPNAPGGKLKCSGPTGNSFPRNIGNFSLNHLCGSNGPKYTSYPNNISISITKNVTGYAGEQFWFDREGNFCMSDDWNFDPPSDEGLGWWSGETTKCIAAIQKLWLNVNFSEDQTGCTKPLREWDIPKTRNCTDIFYKLLDDCDTGTTTAKNGGIYTQNTPNGCVEWNLWATIG